jgi:hypothetical protein
MPLGGRPAAPEPNAQRPWSGPIAPRLRRYGGYPSTGKPCGPNSSSAPSRTRRTRFDHDRAPRALLTRHPRPTDSTPHPTDASETAAGSVPADTTSEMFRRTVVLRNVGLVHSGCAVVEMSCLTCWSMRCPVRGARVLSQPQAGDKSAGKEVHHEPIEVLGPLDWQQV